MTTPPSTPTAPLIEDVGDQIVDVVTEAADLGASCDRCENPAIYRLRFTPPTTRGSTLNLCVECYESYEREFADCMIEGQS